MTKEVKILRGALENVSESLDDVFIRIQTEHVKKIADKALEEADKVRDE